MLPKKIVALLVRNMFVRGVVVGALTFGALCLVNRGTLSAPPESQPKEESPADSKDPQEALSAFNGLIGEWRGVGQPRRGSNAGAWFETAEWVWDFEEKTPALRYEVAKGQLLKKARLTWNIQENQFHLKAQLPDDTRREYVGNLNEAGKLVLESAADAEGPRHRLTLTPLNEKRTLVLYEQRTGQAPYRRVAEVGYTRQGTSLVEEGAGEVECVVTGGKGTIAVAYQGRTYYVCCSGCKQAFEEDSAGIIAAFEKKAAERKQKPSH